MHPQFLDCKMGIKEEATKMSSWKIKSHTEHWGKAVTTIQTQLHAGRGLGELGLAPQARPEPWLPPCLPPLARPPTLLYENLMLGNDSLG